VFARGRDYQGLHTTLEEVGPKLASKVMTQGIAA
jgi:hypothetical protein